ncbi:transmembrane protein 174 [Stegostoma tigrinum]|uniref:transmembrane protein 174 n=1 Tax=Stegostoma tigrinum TaxID=3053191 RepID=UPI00202B9666|nr:transmembrane protein 174 [Stegostoma tigrinum]
MGLSFSTDCAMQMEQRSSNVEDFPVNVFSVTPCQPRTPGVQVSDGDKAGATLLFSGVFLVLVGITFTIMGWIKYYGTSDLEWTQLLGPILLSVGVTFVLIAVCKFRMLTCKTCKQINESALEIEQTPCGQSFVFTGINQPITFHGATVVQYIPPPYASPTQDGITMNTTRLQSLNNAQNTNPADGTTGTTPCPPQYYTIYPLDSTAFAGDDNCPPYQGPENEIIRSEESQDESEATLTADEVPDSIPPPSYDEIFPVVSEDTVER